MYAIVFTHQNGMKNRQSSSSKLNSLINTRSVYVCVLQKMDAFIDPTLSHLHLEQNEQII